MKPSVLPPGKKSILPCAVLLLCLISLCSACRAAVPASAAPAASPETPESSQILMELSSETPEETEEESAVPQSAAAAQEEELPPEPGLVRSPLTNEWISRELAEKRPIAVMYPTDKKAQPQYGLDRVEIFYEIMEEGSMSRQMGILQDWEDLDRIGNIRSVRDYFIYEALEWDGILVHFGGPEVFVKPMLTRKDVDNINGVDGAMGPSYNAFYRVPAGTNSVHSAYTDGKHLLSAIEKAGFERNLRQKYYDPSRWKFAPASAPADLSERADSVPALKLEMHGCYPITSPVLSYNEDDGLYYRSIYGAPQRDAVTGGQLSFSNILIESCTSGSRGAGYLYFHVLDQGHEGYFLTGGRMIHCTWSKTADYETTRFYDDNGEEITLNTGRTMVFIARDGQDSFLVDGIKYDL